MKTRAIVTSALCLLTSLSMVACQGDKKEAKKLSYELSENGCSTGKKEFNTLEEYCASLADDKANNSCAPNLRQQEYERQCKKVSKPTPQNNPEQESTSIPDPGSDSGVTPDPDVQITRQPAPQVSEKSELQALAVTASANHSLDPKTTISGDELLTVLSGEIPVIDMSAEIEGDLNVIGVKSNFKPGFTPCTLSTQNFSFSNNNKTIEFTLMGIEKKSASPRCMEMLTRFSMEGFSVEFENVRVGGPLSQKSIKKVLLKVKP